MVGVPRYLLWGFRKGPPSHLWEVSDGAGRRDVENSEMTQSTVPSLDGAQREGVGIQQQYVGRAAEFHSLAVTMFEAWENWC